MKRIDTSTAAADANGTGRDGFTNGDPGVPTPATEVDDTWLNALQEEICQTIELGGVALDSGSTTQLREEVARSDGMSSGYLDGFDLVSTSGLTGEMAAVNFVYNGRRYHAEPEDMTGSGSLTFTANRNTFVTIAPDDTAGTSFTVAQAVGDGPGEWPTLGDSDVVVGVVETDGSSITDYDPWDQYEQGYPRNEVGHGTARAVVLAPSAATSGVADQQGNSLGREGTLGNRHWRRSYVQERVTRSLASAETTGRHRAWMRVENVTEGTTTAVALDYFDLGNSQTLGAMAHIVALRTDVATGQSKMWHVGRQFARDSGGTISFVGSEIRQETTASGTADISWSITTLGDDPYLILDAGAAGDWTFYAYITTIKTDD